MLLEVHIDDDGGACGELLVHIGSRVGAELLVVDDGALGVDLFLFVGVVKVECERGVDRRVGDLAPGTRDGPLALAAAAEVAAELGAVTTENRDGIGGPKTDGVLGGRMDAQELLPPGTVVVRAVRIWLGGLDTEWLERGVEPSLVLVNLLASETKEEEEEVGKEGKDPDGDTKLEAGGAVHLEKGGGDLVETVELVVSVFPRDPVVHAIVQGIVQEHVETEWEDNGELDSREAHEAEVAVRIEARGVGVEEFLEAVSTLEEGLEGEDAEDDGDEGEDSRPHKPERVRKGDVVDGVPTPDALDDVGAVTLNDHV